MRVLITGVTGQLGHALQRSVPASMAGEPVELIACSRKGGRGCIPLDLADGDACQAVVQRIKPDWLINAAAYTAVDHAESEPELAHAVNARAPAAFAAALQVTGGRLLQLSTDFVFDGSHGSPYRPEQLVEPLGVYGASKAAGERSVLELLPAEGQAVVLRTSWVYGPVGRNFLLTMLRLHRERAAADTHLPVVADQVGCPTSTTGLAAACWRVLKLATELKAPLPSLLHWSDAGAATWYDFAVSIGELGVTMGLLEHAAKVIPIETVDFPTPARRPSYSLLNCCSTREALGLPGTHWRSALAEVLRTMAAKV